MRAVILIVLGVQLSISSPLGKQESSFGNGAEPCSLGSWECLKEKTSKLPSEPRTSMSEPAPLISKGCPPGIWICKRAAPKVPLVETMVAPAADTSTGERRRRAEKKKVDFAGNDNDDDNDPENCLSGICRKKRMLRRMMKEASRVQRSPRKCPPGIWVC